MSYVNRITNGFVIAVVCGTLSASAKISGGVVHCNAELDRGVLPAGMTQTAIVKITLDAPEAPRSWERPPVNLTIVLDRSGSMSGQKIQRAREAAIEALRRLDDRDIFSMVIYDDRVETLVPAQSVRNMEWIEGRIRSITPGGNTALFAGVSQGAAEIRKCKDRRFVHRVLLLSDGLANVGPSNPGDLARLGTALRKENISVTTIGVGTDYNEDLMTQLAMNSDGNTYFVESSRDLPRIFAAELGDVLSIVAKKVELEIECEDGVRPLRIVGRDGRVSANKVEIEINQLYGGQQKYVLVEVEVPAGTVNETKQVVRANCEYENALTQNRHTSVGSATARFSHSQEEVTSSVNREVQEDLVENEAAIVKDQAVQLWDEGKRGEAIRVLNGLLDARHDLPVPVIKATVLAVGAKEKEFGGVYIRDKNIIYVDLENLQNTNDAINVFIHEYAHYWSQEGDGSKRHTAVLSRVGEFVVALFSSGLVADSQFYEYVEKTGFQWKGLPPTTRERAMKAFEEFVTEEPRIAKPGLEGWEWDLKTHSWKR